MYLDSETLDRAVLRCAGQHASVLTNPTGFRTSLPQGSPIGSGSIRWGLRLADSVLRRVVTRGDADRLRVVMGRQVPAMYDGKHSWPVRRLPWILISTPPGAI